jgi:hypothetical protein
MELVVVSQLASIRCLFVVFCIMTLKYLVDGYKCFKGTYCLYLQCRSELFVESCWLQRSGGGMNRVTEDRGGQSEPTGSLCADRGQLLQQSRKEV